MDFLSANWIWLLLGLAVVWMLVSRGGWERRRTAAEGFRGRRSFATSRLLRTACVCEPSPRCSAANRSLRGR